MRQIELYIHIPFCIRKCNYCDFLSFASDAHTREAYITALCHEIRETGKLAGDYQVRSVFLGGGTPSILTVEESRQILQSLKESFYFEDKVEISMESNPGTLDGDKLLAYHEMGINRLSIGLQSTEDDCLRRLGRIHTFDQFKSNYEQARKAGFTNINIDLMSALPGQTLESYEKTLRTVMDLRPEHISSYSLILEEGTPFYEDEDLIDCLPDEDSERKMYEITKRILGEAGYERYEISNYAQAGYECIHNLGYWDDVSYIGMGLGASSYWKGARYSNERDLDAYLDRPFLPLEEREDYHLLSREEHMEEFMFLGLRKCKGIDLKRFETIFGSGVEEIYGEIIDRYLASGHMVLQGDKLALTERGIDVSNHIFSEFLMNS